MSLVTQTNHNVAALCGFEEFSSFVHTECGIVLSESKSGMILSRLKPILQAKSIRNLGSYYEYLRSSGTTDDKRQMISALTTNVSSFFREPHHFDLLQSEMMQNIKEILNSGNKVRIWSAGCSTGQEPYSIAIKILQEDEHLANKDLLILATDIDEKVLKSAKYGTYKKSQLSGLTEAQVEHFFHRVDDESFCANGQLKKIIRFKYLNLVNPWPMNNQFDIIFCRNVVIYFDKYLQTKLWGGFGKYLKPDGLIFVGHSERINHDDFKPIGSTAYVYKGRSAMSSGGMIRRTN